MSIINFFSLMGLMGGSLLVVSSSGWFMIWVGLELNLIFFLFIMMESDNQISLESILKYFLIQASMSLMMIFMFLEGALKLKLMLVLILMVKLGMPPFHFWFVSMNETLSYFNSFLFITWQKLAPLMVICLWMGVNMILVMLVLMFFILGINLNQVMINKIIAYSSLFHLIWMSLNLVLNQGIFVSYYLLYSYMMLMLILSFKFMNFTYIMKASNNIKGESFILFIILLSLMGMPPMSGFLLKWMTVMNLLKLKFLNIILIMLVMSSMNFYIYNRLLFNKIMNSSMKYYTLKKSNKHMIMIWTMFMFVYGLLFL